MTERPEGSPDAPESEPDDPETVAGMADDLAAIIDRIRSRSTPTSDVPGPSPCSHPFARSSTPNNPRKSPFQPSASTVSRACSTFLLHNRGHGHPLNVSNDAVNPRDR